MAPKLSFLMSAFLLLEPSKAFHTLPSLPCGLNNHKRLCALASNLKYTGPSAAIAATSNGGALAPAARYKSNLHAALLAASAALTSAPIPSSLPISLSVNTVLFAPLVLKGQSMLTPAGMLHAWILGTILWASLGWQGWSLCVIYLFAGSKVTKVKMKEKETLGISEGRGGRRGPENVWGSAATGAACALAGLQWPQHRALFAVGYVASMATKLSDTFQSEVGKAYGKRCFLITTLKPVPRGTEGAVSLEGYLAGVVGSLIIAVYGAAVQLVGWNSVGVTALAALVATTAESLIGATAQGRFKLLTNEVVNFILTVIGAGTAMALAPRLLF